MDEDSQYFYQRAEQELRMAQQAQSAAATRAHYILASYYLDLSYSDRRTSPAELLAELNCLHIADEVPGGSLV
ncbi:hypothetical protein EOD43_18255 [Sphingomonas crocodyli]|uniref:Uncharacterized protein n=1 Tax=Sphingomonas crocodyli TaxID=1979270 RepID=A0A437LXU4_9SPHN|nr:hypothetical protein EOD43_18255 [Sphingomonas crocodyli]